MSGLKPASATADFVQVAARLRGNFAPAGADFLDDRIGPHD
jgi:hypothetical protein